MAGRADRNQEFGGMLPRSAVVYGALMGGSADAAGMSVAFEDQVAMAAEAGSGVYKLAVAGVAEAGDGRGTRPAGAEQPPLLGARCGTRHKKAGSPIVAEKKHYR